MNKKEKKLGPVELRMKIEDCTDCPFCEADECFTACEMKGGPSLPVYERDDQVITPPANCPLRKLKGKTLDAERVF